MTMTSRDKWSHCTVQQINSEAPFAQCSTAVKTVYFVPILCQCMLADCGANTHRLISSAHELHTTMLTGLCITYPEMQVFAHTKLIIMQGWNEGGKGGTIPRAPNHYGEPESPNNVASKYFLQYRTLASERSQVRTWGAKFVSRPGRHLTSVRPCHYVRTFDSLFLETICMTSFSDVNLHQIFIRSLSKVWCFPQIFIFPPYF